MRGVNDIINTDASECSGNHKEHSTIISVPSIRTRVKTVETLTHKMIWMWSEAHQLLLMVNSMEIQLQLGIQVMLYSILAMQRRAWYPFCDGKWRVEIERIP